MIKPPKDIFFYFRYVGLGLIFAGVITQSIYSRYVAGIGFLLLTVSFLRKKAIKNE